MTPILIAMLITVPIIALVTWAYLCHREAFRRVIEVVSQMSWIFHHPVWSGFTFEAMLVGLFLLFPVGPCTAPALGVVVVILHYPALLFVERVLGIDDWAYQLLLASALMVPIWIGIRLTVRRMKRAAVYGLAK